MIRIAIGLIYLFSAHWGFAQVPNELDLFYGDTGVVEIDIDELDHLNAIANLNSEIYFAGYTGYYDTSFHYDGLIAKLDSTGILDTNFNHTGYFRFDFPGNNHTVVNDIEVSDSGVFFIGNSLNIGDVDTLNLFIGKLTLNGQLDTTFGNLGYFHPTLAGTYDNGYEIKLLNNGKILFCGSTTASNLEHPLMGRLNYNGGLDSTFGSTGMRVWSWDGSLVDGMDPVLLEKHGAGGYLTKSTLVDTNYFFTGHYITSTNPMCLMIMVDPQGNIVPSYAGLGYRVFEPAPNYANYIIDNYYKNDTIYTLMDIGGTFDGEVYFYVHNKQGVMQSTNTFSLPGIKLHSKDMAITDNGEIAVSGYMKENGSSSLIYSDGIISLAMDQNGSQNTSYCQNGNYQNKLNTDESGVEDIIYCSGSLFLGGNMDNSNNGNVSDFLIMKMEYNPSLGILEKHKLDVKVYPNPFTSELTIQSEDMIEYIRIFDNLGKLIYSQQINTNVYNLLTEELSKGIYILQIESKGKLKREKLIKQ